MEHVYASIDIGSDSIKVVVCELYKGHLHLLAATSMPSKGVKKGLIIEPALAEESISKALKKTEEMLGVKIKKVLVTVPSHFMNYKFVSGKTTVKKDLISGFDMSASYSDGIKKNLLPNEELVMAIPTVFKIDGKTIVKDPKKMPGKTLEGRALMISSSKKNVYSTVSIIEKLGVELTDISAVSVSDANMFKNEKFQRGISAIVNIGSDMTVLSLYNKGLPVITKIIGMGGKDIDKELCYKYRINLGDARKIKEKFATANIKAASKHEFYETKNPEGEVVKISQKKASKIISAKLEKLLNLVKNELEDLTNKPILYIMVTGGVSNMCDFNYLLKNIMPTARVGKIDLIGVRNNKYSTALGNIIYYLEKLKLNGKDYSMFSEDDMDRLSSPTYLDENTVLGKVFSYFFDE